MSKHPAIYKVPPGAKPKKLSAFPQELATRSDFKTRLEGPKSAPFITQSLRPLPSPPDSMPKGTCLRLGPEGDSWYLYAIDPDRDRVLSERGVQLPTSAHHLNVVPSESVCFLSSAGRVEEGQRQKSRPCSWSRAQRSRPLIPCPSPAHPIDAGQPPHLPPNPCTSRGPLRFRTRSLESPLRWGRPSYLPVVSVFIGNIVIPGSMESPILHEQGP